MTGMGEVRHIPEFERLQQGWKRMYRPLTRANINYNITNIDWNLNYNGKK